jgi:hypothetical protein
MPAFQLLRCAVALAGDQDQVVVRHRGNPIVFPELIILQHIHGEEAITDIHVVGEWDTTQQEVRDRLRIIYGDKYFQEVFPGAAARLPMADGTIPNCMLPIHVPGPTRPDSPDPIIKPLDQFTTPASMPRVVSQYREEPPPPLPEGVDIDTLAGHAADEEDADPFVLADVLATAGGAKPDLPDTASFRARHNNQGVGTAAPRTADHLPDVAGGALKPGTVQRQAVKNRG